MDAFRDRLCHEVNPVMCNGTVASGNMYAALCEHLAQVVQTDAVPVMRDSWSLMASVQARDVRDNCLEEFHTCLKQQTPQLENDVRASLDALYQHIMDMFDKNVMQPDTETRVSLLETMHRRGEEALPTLIRDLTDDANSSLLTAMNGVMLFPQEAKRHVERAEKTFMSRVGSNESAWRAWNLAIGCHSLKWIENLGSKIEEIKAEIEARSNECAALTAELKIAQDAPAALKVREEELMQVIASHENASADALARRVARRV